MTLLPIYKKPPTSRFYLKKEAFPSFFSRLKKRLPLTEKVWSSTTGSLATLCLLLMVLTHTQTAQQLISPLVHSLQFHPSKAYAYSMNDFEKFSFIPGWTTSKYDNIDLTAANTFAFFDIPASDDGTLDTDTSGYTIFHSPESADLFSRIHEQHKKVLVTLTQTTTDEISTFLSSPQAQQELITEAINEVTNTGIDGVLLDFEFNGADGAKYKDAYTQFVNKCAEQFHAQLPQAVVRVAISTEATQRSFFDLKALAAVSDGLNIMAYTFAVPEQQNGNLSTPVYGYQRNQYWKDVNSALENLLQDQSTDHIALETAWYGNGNNYPFYQSMNSDTTSLKPSIPNNTLKTPLSKAVIESLVSEVPSSAQDAARNNLPYIAKALEHEGILTPNVLAYALATIEHETAGTFEPIAEIKGRKSARRLGYEGGTNYFGRGFIQLTHIRNYKKMGERIGMGDALAENPELASQPEVAAKVLAAFFKDNNIAYLASKGYFVDARRPVNPDSFGYVIAEYAWKYRNMLG